MMSERKYIWPKIIFCISFCFFNNLAFSQNMRDFSEYAKSLNIIFTPPVDFTETQCDQFYSPGNDILINAFFYELSSIEKEVTIDVSILDLSQVSDSTNAIIDPRSSYSKNLNYLRVMQIQADVKHDAIHFFSNEESNRLFNAENSAIYTFRNEHSYHEFFNNGHIYKQGIYKNKFPYCKILTIHKENRADIELYFWYNDNSKKSVNEIIKSTRSMLKFIH